MANDEFDNAQTDKEAQKRFVDGIDDEVEDDTGYQQVEDDLDIDEDIEEDDDEEEVEDPA